MPVWLGEGMLLLLMLWPVRRTRSGSFGSGVGVVWRLRR
jgi:hypothetical protein